MPFLPPTLPADAPALAELRAWRDRQERKMRGDHSPFAVERVESFAARSTLGSSPEAAIKLPGEGIPALAGEVLLREGKAILLARDPQLLVNGAFVAEHELEATDWVALGPYRLQYRQPDGGHALRISNLQGEGMKGYQGLKYFPTDERFRVAATFVPSAGNQSFTVDSTHGGPQKLPYAGKLSFVLLGKPFTLDVFVDGDEPEALFLIFRDASSGQESYGVGRYVYVDRGRGGRTTVDFNKAFNPLCAYGPMFFCPIPPRQNLLPVKVLAGEKPYEMP